MSHSDEEAYLTWLYSQVAPVHLRTRSRTYWSLFRQLYKTEFVWTHRMDENRAKDGIALRDEFLREEPHHEIDEEWYDAPCSVLELLVSLSQALAFETDGVTRQWFWQLMHNLRLESLNDATAFEEEEVKQIVERFMRRTYTRDGDGGLFPLRYAEKDQRKVEIWYQLNSYLIEHDD